MYIWFSQKYLLKNIKPIYKQTQLHSASLTQPAYKNKNDSNKDVGKFTPPLTRNFALINCLLLLHRVFSSCQLCLMTERQDCHSSIPALPTAQSAYVLSRFIYDFFLTLMLYSAFAYNMSILLQFMASTRLNKDSWFTSVTVTVYVLVKL